MSKPTRVHLKRYNKKNVKPIGIRYWDFLTNEEIYGYDRCQNNKF